MTNKFLRISPEINAEWERVSTEAKEYFYQTFTSQIINVFNYRKAHDRLKYDFVEDEKLVEFGMKIKKTSGGFYYLLTEINRKLTSDVLKEIEF